MSHKHKLTGEDIAKIEIGHTDVSAGVRRFLFVAFLAVIFAVPLVQYALEARAKVSARSEAKAAPAPAESSTPLRRAASADDVDRAAIVRMWHVVYDRNARLLRLITEFEKNLGDNSFLNDWPVPEMKRILVGLLGAGTEDVYCGRDGWLFFRPDIDYLTGKGFLDPGELARRLRQGNEWKAPPQPDPVKAIVEFRDQLAKRGVELIVLPAPPKSVIHPEMFSGRFTGVDERLQNPSYAAFKSELRKQGVRLFDAAEILERERKNDKQPLYQATDTHWTPAGAELVAAQLADYVKEARLLPEAPPANYVRRPKQLTGTGDLAGMLRLPEGSNAYPPETATIAQITAPNGAMWRPDPNADILFLGDSFCNIYSLPEMGWGASGGLVEQFSFDMQRPVDAIRINDSGAFRTRLQLSREMAQGTDRLAGKKLVIYEFAMRELAVGDWRTGLTLAAGQTRKKEPAQAATPQGIRVSGTIREITRSPRPGSVPYKDCVVAFHLTDLAVARGRLTDKEIVVFAWGMRDNKLLGAASYRSGERITLDLVPWESAQSRYGSFNRVELEGDDLLLLPVYWSGESLLPPTAAGDERR